MSLLSGRQIQPGQRVAALNEPALVDLSQFYQQDSEAVREGFQFAYTFPTFSQF